MHPAASLMRSATALGCDLKGLWSTGRETTVDFILCAVNRCVSGETMMSLFAMRNHDGFSFHAGWVIGSTRHLAAIGFCAAAITAVSSAEASGATALRKSSTFSQKNPSWSG